MTATVPETEVRALSRQAERSERSTEALLDAAAELIAEVGLVAMTFAAIGERAGYSRGMVTARFGSKDGLVAALVKRVWGSLRSAGVVPITRGGPALDALVSLVDGIEQLVSADDRDMKAMVALLFQAPSSEPELRARMTTFSDNMRGDISIVLAHGIDDGSVRADIDPDAEATLLAASMHGIAYQWLLAPDRIDPAAAYGALRATLLHRYAAPGG